MSGRMPYYEKVDRRPSVRVKIWRIWWCLRTRRLKPGDVLVFQTQRAVPREFYDHAHRMVREAFGPGQQVLIISDGLSLGVIRRRWAHRRGAAT